MSKVESLKASVKICMFDQYGTVVDMPAALARLQARYKLVVLSNGDPDMLESAKHYHGIPFNRVISVAEAGSFKPHVATYTTAAKLLDVRMCCSWLTTPSTASVRSRPACAQPSSIAGSARLA